MTLQPAGTEIGYTVTWLEMTEPPETGPGPAPDPGLALVPAEAPPVWYFLSLYDAVGRDYAWEDIHTREHAEIGTWLHAGGMRLTTLMGRGWPQGFYLIDGTTHGVTDLAYFGLVPEAVGRGLGRWFLSAAIAAAWDVPGTEKITVNTCTLDHPRALAAYEAAGFRPVRREAQSRILTRPRDLSRIPA
jgi:GNAT superfamily N-acetyltransferase